MLLILLASLMRSHGKLSTLDSQNLSQRLKIFLKGGTAEKSDEQGQIYKTETSHGVLEYIMVH